MPERPVVLSREERAAIAQLRRRGAAVTVFAGAGDVLVHFPLGAAERQWQKEGRSTPECGMLIAYDFAPEDSGPPMTDQDLAYLERLPRLQRVNFGGTQVSASAIAKFRHGHPSIVVDDHDEE